MTTTAPSTSATPSPSPPPPTRSVRLGRRRVPVVLPRRGDPRLRLSAVIVTLQVLGQTVLDFKVSIAQILVTVGLCAAIEVVVTFRQQGVLAWPASALLTGNSIAFILRASGTRHGDWWSLHGIEWFVLAAVLALLSKHLIRPTGRHLFNPSNVALVWVLLVVGPRRVFPQYLWWGPLEPPVIAAMVVILAGAVWVLRPVRMAAMSAAFLATFALFVTAFALGGRSFVAIWREAPVDGLDYARLILTSPELLVFVFFMMSDPQTAPRTSTGRIAYGMVTAVVAAALVLPQTTEFGIKLAVLASLTVVTAAVPFIESVTRRLTAGPNLPPPSSTGAGGVGLWPRVAAAARRPAVVAAAIVVVAAPVNTAALAENEELILIERGLSTTANPQ